MGKVTRGIFKKLYSRSLEQMREASWIAPLFIKLTNASYLNGPYRTSFFVFREIKEYPKRQKVQGAATPTSRVSKSRPVSWATKKREGGIRTSRIKYVAGGGGGDTGLARKVCLSLPTPPSSFRAPSCCGIAWKIQLAIGISLSQLFFSLPILQL